jgi:hypothetical protein
MMGNMRTHRALAGGRPAECAQGGESRGACLRVAVPRGGDQPPQRVAVQGGSHLVAAAVASQGGGGSTPDARLTCPQARQAAERGGGCNGREAGGEGQEAVPQLGWLRLRRRGGMSGCTTTGGTKKTHTSEAMRAAEAAATGAHSESEGEEVR